MSRELIDLFCKCGEIYALCKCKKEPEKPPATKRRVHHRTEGKEMNAFFAQQAIDNRVKLDAAGAHQTQGTHQSSQSRCIDPFYEKFSASVVPHTKDSQKDANQAETDLLAPSHPSNQYQGPQHTQGIFNQADVKFGALQLQTQELAPEFDYAGVGRWNNDQTAPQYVERTKSPPPNPFGVIGQRPRKKLPDPFMSQQLQPPPPNQFGMIGQRPRQYLQDPSMQQLLVVPDPSQAQMSQGGRLVTPHPDWNNFSSQQKSFLTNNNSQETSQGGSSQTRRSQTPVPPSGISHPGGSTLIPVPPGFSSKDYSSQQNFHMSLMNNRSQETSQGGYTGRTSAPLSSTSHPDYSNQQDYFQEHTVDTSQGCYTQIQSQRGQTSATLNNSDQVAPNCYQIRNAGCSQPPPFLAIASTVEAESQWLMRARDSLGAYQEKFRQEVRNPADCVSNSQLENEQGPPRISYSRILESSTIKETPIPLRADQESNSAASSEVQVAEPQKRTYEESLDYICFDARCNVPFETSGSRTRHVKTHHSDGILCRMCFDPKKIAYEDIKKHQTECHYCHKCGCLISEKEMQLHRTLQVCSRCDLQFACEALWHSHKCAEQ